MKETLECKALKRSKNWPKPLPGKKDLIACLLDIVRLWALASWEGDIDLEISRFENRYDKTKLGRFINSRLSNKALLKKLPPKQHKEIIVKLRAH
jgi:hypothetical protein